MIIIKNKEYPDGTEILMNLLGIFPVLKRDQVEIYMMETDKTFNKERTKKLIGDLIEMNEIHEDKDGDLFIRIKKENRENLIKAFWVFLKFAAESFAFDIARYPAEIVFKHKDEISEIIVCDGDFLERLDFLSKRKKRKNKCHYYLLLQSNTIEDLDDDLYPDEPFTIITMSEEKNNEVPKLVYHEIIKESSEEES